MHVILWAFQVKSGCESEFERAYGPQGDWAEFFGQGEGYLGTELLRRLDRDRGYVTVDRWTTRAAYESFRAERSADYETLDRRFEPLTEDETLLGSFSSVADSEEAAA